MASLTLFYKENFRCLSELATIILLSNSCRTWLLWLPDFSATIPKEYLFQKFLSSYSLSMESLACSVFFSEFKASLSPSKNVVFIFFNESPLKMIKNAILFHVKSSFCSSDIYIFVLTLWLCRKTA